MNRRGTTKRQAILSIVRLAAAMMMASGITACGSGDSNGIRGSQNDMPADRVWHVTFFNNQTFSGQEHVAHIKGVDRDWGLGAPTDVSADAGLGVDNFSSRWHLSAPFTAGRYRFSATVAEQDRLVLKVLVPGRDPVVVFNHWDPSTVAGTYTEEVQFTSAEVEAGANTFDVVIEHADHGGAARLKVDWERVVDDGTAGETLWHGNYYNRPDPNGTPDMIADHAPLRFDWGLGAPGTGFQLDNFSVHWVRTTYFSAGKYRFFAKVKANDGVRVEVDGQQVVNKWDTRDINNPAQWSGDAELSEGFHTVAVDFVDFGGEAGVEVYWQRLDGGSSDAHWSAEYFNNTTLQGAPAFTRNDAQIDFNWASGSPDGTIQADGFSARWTRSIAFEAGRYEFSVQANDGVRIYIDNQLVIDEWHDTYNKTYTVERDMEKRSYPIRVEYYENTGPASIKFSYRRVDGGSTTNTWRAEYFGNAALQGAPIVVREDAEVKFDWGTGAPADGVPADTFSVRWTRELDFTEGQYEFIVRADDGVRVFLDGETTPLINEWHAVTGQTYRATKNLSGKHKIVVEFYEDGDKALIDFGWRKVDGGSTAGVWRAEYYKNKTLSGAPFVTRDEWSAAENRLFRDWGVSEPVSGVGVDNFSARFTRRLYFAGGKYKWIIRADDGIRIFIDGHQVLNQWHDSPYNRYEFTADISDGQHDIVIEYYEHTLGAGFDVRWTREGGDPHGETRWFAEYYNNANWSGTPVASGEFIVIDEDWGYNAPLASQQPDNFSIKWTKRNVWFDNGNYRFSVRTHGGVLVWIDGWAVINQPYEVSYFVTYQNVFQQVGAGYHTVTVNYFDTFGYAAIDGVSWTKE